MKRAGLTVVRVGESAWGVFEPQEGNFEFEWMDRILDKMHAAGIKVILGTPTYSIPAWLAYKHPEVLAEHAKGNKAYYGIRQNMDFTNPTYQSIANGLSARCWKDMHSIRQSSGIKWTTKQKRAE